MMKLAAQAAINYIGGLIVICILLFLPAGSLPAFIIMLPFPLLLVKRILNEEKILEEGLAGYREYEDQVRYRLIPFLW